MKTAKEIKYAIAVAMKEEKERQELVKWALGLIDEASEKMHSNLSITCKLEVEGRMDDFEKAWDQEEVITCLTQNGFSITRLVSDFVLKLK